MVDLSAFWAGPFATLYLASMGADVIKVESIAHPDGHAVSWAASPALRYWERSMVFAGANPSKRDLTLDLDSDDGRALLWRLIDDADVVIENFTPRVLEQFGIVWPDVHLRCPRLILVRMPAFGLDGPWQDRAGFAMTIEQTSGLAWLTGYPDLPLVPRGPCDPVGGMHTVIGLLGALEVRRRTGLGQLLEVPLIDGALNMAAEQVLEFERTGEVLTRHANRGPYAAPQGVYPAAGDERWIAISVATDEQWSRLARVVGATALASDPELLTAGGRHARHDEIDAAIRAWTTARSPEEGADQLRAAGVPAADVTPAQLRPSQPPVRAPPLSPALRAPGDRHHGVSELSHVLLGARSQPVHLPTTPPRRAQRRGAGLARPERRGDRRPRRPRRDRHPPRLGHRSGLSGAGAARAPAAGNSRPAAACFPPHHARPVPYAPPHLVAPPQHPKPRTHGTRG